MADLGPIGRNSTQPFRTWTQPHQSRLVQSTHLGSTQPFRTWTQHTPRLFQGTHLTMGQPRPYTARNDADGTPAPPCELQQGPGRDSRILWPVNADGNPRTFSIWVRHPGIAPYPRIILLANPDIGLNHDIVVEATATTDWQELVASFTPRANGVVRVIREVQAPVQNAYALWDRITVS